jgi:hypothetical protein
LRVRIAGSDSGFGFRVRIPGSDSGFALRDRSPVSVPGASSTPVLIDTSRGPLFVDGVVVDPKELAVLPPSDRILRRAHTRFADGVAPETARDDVFAKEETLDTPGGEHSASERADSVEEEDDFVMDLTDFRRRREPLRERSGLLRPRRGRLRAVRG